MQRLILEYQESDGFTYNCTNTLAIVYASKEKAVSDFETLLLEHQEALEKKDKDLEVARAALEKARQNFYKVMDKTETNSDRKKAEVALSEATKAYADIDASAPDEFKFGGQTLYYSNFSERSDSGEKYLTEPSIYTLDEFFSDVEKQ